MNTEEPIEPISPWKFRIGITILMLILAFIGLIFTNIQEEMGWNYWRAITPIYGLLCLFTSWYLRKKNQVITSIKLWHEVLHWVGLFGGVVLISSFVDRGIMSRFAAGVSILTLLGFSVYIAGIYIERSFIVIGIVLALFAGFASFLQQYLYFIIIPLFLIAGVSLFFAIKRKRNPKDL